MIQSLPHIMLGYYGFFHLCMCFIVRNVHRIVQTIFYSLMFTTSSFTIAVTVCRLRDGGGGGGGDGWQW